MTSSPRGARRRRPVLVPVALAVITAGIGVTAAFGGLKEAPDEPPPKARPGEVVDQGEFRTQFIKAVDTVERSEFGQTKRYLNLVLKVTNTGDRTANVGMAHQAGQKWSPFAGFAGALVRMTPEIKQKYGPEAYVLSYGVKSAQLHPGITTTVVVQYELEPSAAAPTSVTLDVGRFVHEKVGGLLDQSRAWQIEMEEDADPAVPVVATQVTLPVRQEEA
ncbi:hypothetical protein [Microtetraspora sp. NBRC 16547]|uniref:hypothetical protein n=1 Tax=Microtetraspora sp. NBRC 16547 TaxID=3030993 RepID=UPI0024A46247|nr:hypothetical protein [Microtetraspora sp. NBRC 16547]GLW96432.1 hypothetical protein Misp02_05190 [Microtetraspora sp. NBRC 16547]